jgi:hypothetical protein
MGEQIRDLFDLVVGTSTGGIIGLGLTSSVKLKTVAEVNALFRKLSHKVFAQSMAGKFINVALKRHMYSRDPLHNFVLEYLGNHSLFGNASPHVAVTTIEANSLTTKLFTSYNREDEKLRLIVGRNATIDAAAEATSAAPFFFPPFVHQGSTYMDGGLGHNNPCLVARDEAGALFNEAPTGVHLSIGTGFYHLDKPPSGLLDTALIFPALLTGHQQFNLLKISSDAGFRFDFKMSRDFGLGDASALDTLVEETGAYLKNDQTNILDRACNRLFKALFYAELVKFASSAHLVVEVRSRITLKSNLDGRVSCDSFQVSVIDEKGDTVKGFVAKNTTLERVPGKCLVYKAHIYPTEAHHDFSFHTCSYKVQVMCNLSVDISKKYEALPGCPLSISKLLTSSVGS